MNYLEFLSAVVSASRLRLLTLISTTMKLVYFTNSTIDGVLAQRSRLKIKMPMIFRLECGVFLSPTLTIREFRMMVLLPPELTQAHW